VNLFHPVYNNISWKLTESDCELKRVYYGNITHVTARFHVLASKEIYGIWEFYTFGKDTILGRLHFWECYNFRKVTLLGMLQFGKITLLGRLQF